MLPTACVGNPSKSTPTKGDPPKVKGINYTVVANIMIWVPSNLLWQGGPSKVTRSAGDLGHVLAGSVVFHVALDQMAGSLGGDEGQLPS